MKVTKEKNTEAVLDVSLIAMFLESCFMMAIIISEISRDAAAAPFQQDQTDAPNRFANFKHSTVSFQERENLAALN